MLKTNKNNTSSTDSVQGLSQKKVQLFVLVHNRVRIVVLVQGQ